MIKDRNTSAAAMPFLALSLGIWACGATPAPDNGEQAHEAREEEGAHSEERVVAVESSQLHQLGIEIEVAGPGMLEVATEVPGEVQVNGDRMAHVAPRVGGVVLDVLVSLGDTVRSGEILAVLESRELADAKAAYLAAKERLTLADAVYQREERLWNQKVSSEQDYLDARRDRAETRIELRAAQQKLHALGIPQAQLDGLQGQHDAAFTEYQLRAPFDGSVIDRHITMGETVSAGSPVFTIADLGTVWIDLSVYQKDIGSVRKGQSVLVGTGHGDEVELSIEFVQPLVGEETRTAMARIIAPNPDGIWHPGCFVTARVTTSTTEARIVVPVSAVIRMEDGDDVVFVETADGFQGRKVSTGLRSRHRLEVLDGLDPGDRYVSVGGFSLKAELGKESFGDGHGH